MTDEVKYPRPLEVRYADIFAEIRRDERKKKRQEEAPVDPTIPAPSKCQGLGCWKPAIGPLLDSQNVVYNYYCRLCGDRTMRRLQKEGTILHRP